MQFKEIKKLVKENAPSGKVSQVDVEGPKVVLYTSDLEYFIDHNEEVRNLASTLKKRIILRSDPSRLVSPEEAVEIIKKEVPEEADITDIKFDEDFQRIYIEARKLGLVIGKHGSTLDKIMKKTKWNIKLLRKPPIDSEIIDSVRNTLYESSEEIQKNLKNFGRKIYRKPDADCDWIRLTPLGGARQVGRSCFLLQTPESNILLDCGINVAASGKERFPDFRAMKIETKNLDAVVISHAHLDHSGFLPYLFKYDYSGPVYCTEPTRDLMTMLQLDALKVSEKNDQELPYSSRDIRKALKHTVLLEYEEVADITPDMRVTFYNAGHILGSSIIHLHIGEGFHNLVYSGDIKFGDTRLFEAANYEFPRVETLVLESTYWGRYDIQPSRKEAEEKFISTIEHTIKKKKGKLLVPVFAVGRSQEVMMVLENYFRKNDLDVPVYLDGMILEATAIHSTYPEYLKGYLKSRIFNGNNPFLAEVFKKVDSKKRQDIIESDDSSIILATSGMMVGGPSVEYFQNLAPEEKNTLAFVGYQAEGSLGRRLQNGVKEMPLEKDGKRKTLNVNMDIKTIEGFSGHADRRQLLGYSKKIYPQPEQVIVVHGEEDNVINLGMTLHDMFGFEPRTIKNLESVRIV